MHFQEVDIAPQNLRDVLIDGRDLKRSDLFLLQLEPVEVLPISLTRHWLLGLSIERTAFEVELVAQQL